MVDGGEKRHRPQFDDAMTTATVRARRFGVSFRKGRSMRRMLFAFIPVFLVPTATAASQPKGDRSLNFVCTFDQTIGERTLLDVEVNQATNKGSVTVRNNGNRTPVNATLTPTMLILRYVFDDELTVEYTIDRTTLAFDQHMLSARDNMFLPGTCELADAANRRF